MFVIIENGGKQYKVSEGQILKLEKFDCEKDDVIKIKNVLLLNNNKNETIIGCPYVDNVEVKAQVINRTKDKKVLIFKKKRRHNYRRKIGHRQEIVILKIIKILVGSKSSEKNPEIEKKVVNEKKEINQPKE